MHRVSLQENLTLYDSSLTDEERSRIRTAKVIHLITWVMDILVILYLIYIIVDRFESVFMGYIVFSVFALVASILYARRYKSWYGHNILIYFILLIFIIVNFMIFIAAIFAEFYPSEYYGRLRRGHDEWWQVAETLAFFFVPILHSLALIYLYAVRRNAEHRVLRDRGGLKIAQGKQILEYKPQVDDNDVERNLRGSKNIR